MADLSPAKIIRKRKNDVIIKKGYANLIMRTVVIFLVFWILLSYVFLIYQVNGNAMFPAIKDGDLVISYRLHNKYEKNDVVVYEADGKRRVGRVLALESDIIKITPSGILYVNGTAQSGQILYPTYYIGNENFTFTVPEGSCYILGDYRTECEDSRNFGAIKIDDLDGKIISVFRRRSI